MEREDLMIREDLNIVNGGIGFVKEKEFKKDTSYAVLRLNDEKLEEKDRLVKIKIDNEFMSLKEMFEAHYKGQKVAKSAVIKEGIFKNPDDATEFVSQYIEVTLINDSVHTFFVKNYKAKMRIDFLYDILKENQIKEKKNGQG